MVTKGLGAPFGLATYRRELASASLCLVFMSGLPRSPHWLLAEGLQQAGVTPRHLGTALRLGL